nr:protein FAR1-RELATED SEQUENCE 5-like [Ipomoea batatas]
MADMEVISEQNFGQTSHENADRNTMQGTQFVPDEEDINREARVGEDCENEDDEEGEYECIPDCDGSIKPHLGQRFKTLDEGVRYYKEYAAFVGFDVRASTVKKNRYGGVEVKYLLCSREGYTVTKAQRSPTTVENNGAKINTRRRVSNRVGCMTRCALKLQKDRLYAINVFTESHKHRLCAQDARSFLKINRNLEIGHQAFIAACEKANIGTSKAFDLYRVLADRFLTHYAVNIKPQRNLTHLSGISQDEGETLKTYLTRWQKEVQTIEGLDEQVAITFFMESLRADHLLRICQNERVLLPCIEPKIVPEDVCVTKELDPEEHPEESRRRPWKAFEKVETADQPQKQPREQRGKLCLELRGKPEEYLLGNHQPEIPSGIPHSQSHTRGSEEILLLLREVVGASLPSPHQKEWGEGPRGYPPPRDHRVPASAGGAFLGEPARLNEESAVKEDQRHLSSLLQVV